MTPIPSWLEAAVHAAGMTAYAEDCTFRQTPASEPQPDPSKDSGDPPQGE